MHKEQTRLELFKDEEHCPVFEKIDHEKHVPNHVASLLFEHVQQLRKENKLCGDESLFLINELQSFTDICGACERIKNTPFHSPIAFLLKNLFSFI